MWGLNRLLTKLRHPPIFHGATLFYTISEAPLKGTFYASVPYVLALSLVFHWFATPNQQYPRSEVTPPQLNSMEQTTTYVSSGTGWTPNPDNPGKNSASRISSFCESATRGHRTMPWVVSLLILSRFL